MEVFSNMESQIERAVQLGQDQVVQDLDREMDPVLDAILRYRATSADELQRQLKFLTDLLARRSECPALVQRLSHKISELLKDYFQDGQLRFRQSVSMENGRAVGPSPALVPRSEPVLNGDIARVAVISLDYRFLYCNAVMSEDLGDTPGHLLGRPISDACDRIVMENLYRPHIEMCLAGQLREFDAPCLASGDGPLTYHVRLTPLRNIERQITGVVLVAQPHIPAMAASMC